MTEQNINTGEIDILTEQNRNTDKIDILTEQNINTGEIDRARQQGHHSQQVRHKWGSSSYQPFTKKSKTKRRRKSQTDMPCLTWGPENWKMLSLNVPIFC